METLSIAAIPDSLTFGNLPGLCRQRAKELQEAALPPVPILLFEVRDSRPESPDGSSSATAPDRLLCVTSGLIARLTVSDTIVAVKRREAPRRVFRYPRLQFKPRISLRLAFRELADVGTSAAALFQECEEPYSVFFLRESFMVSEFKKELETRLT